MKKVLMAAFLMAASSSMYAQVNKGQLLVGGTAGFESSKLGDGDVGKNTHIWISPNAGYFFADKFAGGLRVGYESIKNKAADDPESQFTVAPFLRYYFLDAAQKVNIFADASYGFGSRKSEGESASLNQYAISAGPAIFLTPHTALEFALQYRSTGGEIYEFGDEKERENVFGISIGFQIHLGGK